MHNTALPLIASKKELLVSTSPSFDYIIIGAGSAGCVLAHRLSRDSHVRVALIEAGGSDDAPEMVMPVAFTQLFKTRYDWDYHTEPERELDGRRVYQPRGRTLGGSSSMNTMLYIRGNAADFDDWAADGASGWSYADMLHYFRKAETNERGESHFHGASGPLSVQDGRFRHPLVDEMLEASVSAGMVANPDFNGESQMGVGRFQFTQCDGRRCSAATAYLKPVQERQNLIVLTNTLVVQLVLDNRRARGVVVQRPDAQ